MPIFSLEDKKTLHHSLELKDLQGSATDSKPVNSTHSIIALAKLFKLRTQYNSPYARYDSFGENLFKNIIIAYGCQLPAGAAATEELYYIKDYEAADQQRSLVRETEEAWLHLQQKVVQDPNNLLLLNFISEAQDNALVGLAAENIAKLRRGETLEQSELEEFIKTATEANSKKLLASKKITAKTYEVAKVLENPFAMVCGHNEYKERLLTTFFIHLQGDYCVIKEQFLKEENISKERAHYSFSHHKRRSSHFIHNHTFKEELPGRLEETFGPEKNTTNVVNFLSPKLLQTCFSLMPNGDIKFSFPREEAYNKDLWQLLRLKLEKAQIKLQGREAQGSLAAWTTLWKELLTKEVDLEEVLTKHQNSKILETLQNEVKETLTKIPALENSNVQAVKANTKDMQESLAKFRDNILADANFLSHFSGNKKVLETQQYFRDLTNRINIAIETLKVSEGEQNKTCNKADLPRELQDLREEINDLLVTYDLFQQRECFTYQSKITYLTSEELNQFATCFIDLNKKGKLDMQALLELKDLEQNPQEEAKRHLLNRLYFKGDKPTDSEEEKEAIAELSEFIKKIELKKGSVSLSNQELKDFAAHLEKITSCKVRYSSSLLFKEKVSKGIVYVPIIGGEISNIIHPSRARYQNDPEGALTLGTALSAEIRASLGVNTERFRGFDPLQAKEYLFNLRKKLGLIGKREQLEYYADKIESAFSKVFYSAFSALFCFYIGLVILAHIRERRPLSISSLTLFIKVLTNFYALNLFPKHPQFNKFSYYALGVFTAMVLICIIEPIVEFIVQGVFACLITAFKYIDQFIFGRLFAKLFTVITDLVSALIKNISLFTEILSKNIADHGLIDGLIKTWDESNIYSFLTHLPINVSEVVCEAWKRCDKAENLLAANTWSFNIFNPIGSISKIYNIYKIKEHNKDISFNSVSGWYNTFVDNLQIMQEQSLNIEDETLLKIHKVFTERRLLCYSFESSQANLAGSIQKSDTIQDPIFNASFLDNKFSVKQYYKTLAIFTAATSKSFKSSMKKAGRPELLLSNKLTLNTALEALTEQNSPATDEIEKRKTALRGILEQLAGPSDRGNYNNFNSPVFHAVNRREPIFKRTTVHQRAINSLITYYEILEAYPELSQEALVSLDNFFATHLTISMKILSMLSWVQNDRHESPLLKRCRGALSHELGLNHINSPDLVELLNIKSGIRTYFGKNTNIRLEETALNWLKDVCSPDQQKILGVACKLVGVSEVVSLKLIEQALHTHVIADSLEGSVAHKLLEQTDILKTKGLQEQVNHIKKLLEVLQLPTSSEEEMDMASALQYPTISTQEENAAEFINAVVAFICMCLLINFVQDLFLNKPKSKLEDSTIELETGSILAA